MLFCFLFIFQGLSSPTLVATRGTSEVTSKIILYGIEQDPITVYEGQDQETKKLGRVTVGTDIGGIAMTADAQKVLYLVIKNVKPGIAMKSGFGAGPVSIGFSQGKDYGKKKLEGLYLWDRKTNETKILADVHALLTLDDRLDLKVPLSDNLKHHVPNTLFHVKEQEFIWVLPDILIHVDASKNKLKILPDATYISKKGKFTFAFQDLQRRISVFGPEKHLFLDSQLHVQSTDIREWKSRLFLPDGTFAIGHEALFWVTRNQEEKMVPVSFHFLVGEIGTPNLFSIRYMKKQLRIIKVVNEKKVWEQFFATDKKPPPVALFPFRDRTYLFIDGKKEQKTFVLNSETGETLDTNEIGGDLPFYHMFSKGRFTYELGDDRALVFLPSHGYLEGDIKPEWFRGEQLRLKENDALGGLYWLDSDLKLEPILEHWLLDQMVVVFKGQSLLIQNFGNQGMTSLEPTPYGMSEYPPLETRFHGDTLSPILIPWAKSLTHE